MTSLITSDCTSRIRVVDALLRISLAAMPPKMKKAPMMVRHCPSVACPTCPARLTYQDDRVNNEDPCLAFDLGNLGGNVDEMFDHLLLDKGAWVAHGGQSRGQLVVGGG